MAASNEVKKLTNYVNGEWVSSSGQELQVHNPAADEVIAVYGDTTRVETNAAIDVASAAFDGWRSTPPLERARHLMKLKNALDEHHDELAKTIALEHGKVYKEAWLEMERSGR